MDIEKVFTSLVENGLDFLRQSADDLEIPPKYSVIHFAAGVEIMLKARLLREHWSLVLQKPHEAKIRSFQAGDFLSITLDEALRRLEDVLEESFSASEKAAFREVRNHRNRLVHFFHGDYQGAAGSPSPETIAIEQCKAWFYLERLLSDRWHAEFAPFEAAVAAVGARFAKNNSYLEGRFNGLSADIESLIKTGVRIEPCRVCHYLAAETWPVNLPVMEASCLVCHAEYDYVDARCPTCGSAVQLDDLREGQCPKCGFESSLGFTLSAAGPFGEGGSANDDISVAYCMECRESSRQTVVPRGDSFLCVWCLADFSRIEDCGYCNEPLAGGPDSVETYLHGCLFCDGKWDEVKDD